MGLRQWLQNSAPKTVTPRALGFAVHQAMDCASEAGRDALEGRFGKWDDPIKLVCEWSMLDFTMVDWAVQPWLRKQADASL